MKLSAIQIARWVSEAADVIPDSLITSLHKDEIRKLVTIDLLRRDDLRLSYLFLPGESLLFFEAGGRDRRAKSQKTTNFLPQLVGAKIMAIEQVNFDRIVKIVLFKENEYFALVFELFGPGSNVYLLDSDGAIITSLRRSADRDIYIPPSPPDGMYPDEIDKNRIRTAVAEQCEKNVRRFLKEQIRGWDESFWELSLEGLNSGITIGELGDMKLDEMLQSISAAYSECVKGHREIVLKDNTLSWKINDDVAETYHLINDAIADAAIDLSRAFAKKSVRQRISQGLKIHRKRLEDKQTKLKKLLADAEDATQYKLWAELLTINMKKIGRGMTSITVTNLFDENQREIEIPLLEELSPAANVGRLFKRYRKLTDGVTATKKQVSQIKKKLKALDEYKSQLENAKEFRDMLRLEENLIKRDILKKKKMPPSFHRIEAEAHFNPRVFHTSAGEEILVGRNNKENEYVSFVAAKKHDFWFHSQQTPGAHVILKLKDKGKQPSHESIIEVAKIAAYFSRARTSSKVPIIYTEARYLQKIRGGLPGKVKYTHVTSIMVEPGLPERRS